MSIITVNKYPF